MKEIDRTDTLLQMVALELQAMHFYRQAANCLQDEDARFHFDLLAAEELEHARSFHALLSDPDAVSLEEMASGQSRPSPEPDCSNLAELNQLQALEMALQMERTVEDALRRQANEIADRETRTVVEQNILSTEGHTMLIAEDIERLRQADIAVLGQES